MEVNLLRAFVGCKTLHVHRISPGREYPKIAVDAMHSQPYGSIRQGRIWAAGDAERARAGGPRQ